MPPNLQSSSAPSNPASPSRPVGLNAVANQTTWGDAMARHRQIVARLESGIAHHPRHYAVTKAGA